MAAYAQYVLIQDQTEDQWAGLRACGTVVTWLLILYTRGTSILIKWAGLTVLFVLSHASMRVTVSEGNYSTSSRTHPGVPFALFFSNAPSRDYPEPRRVAREMSAMVRDQSRLLWNQAKFYSYYVLDAIRYPYVLYHHARDHQQI